jgi:4,5-DOPA dioxygenase extradiol
MDMTVGAPPYDWAVEFDGLVRKYIDDRKHDKLIDYNTLGPGSHLAIPTPEHYLPLITVLGASGPGDLVEFFNESIDLRSVSMTSLKIG